jgi:hypothetical protein
MQGSIADSNLTNVMFVKKNLLQGRTLSNIDKYILNRMTDQCSNAHT